MGFFSRLVENRSIENPAVPISAHTLAQMLSYGPTHAGVDVTQQNALTYIPVFAAIRIISEAIGQLPLLIYYGSKGDLGNDVELAETHPAFDLLRESPNDEMTAATFKETMQAHVVSWGNGYARIKFDNGGRPRELWPLLPDRTRPERKNGKLRYVTRGQDGEEVYDADEILHIPGLGFDGLQGYSPIFLARQAIGLGLSIEQFDAKLFGQGAWMGGVLEHPGKLGDKAYEKLRASLTETHTGVANAFRPGILEEGMKWHQLSLPSDDALFLLARKFQVEDVARLYRIPPHMLGLLEKATLNNIEMMSMEFVRYSLGIWLKKWVEECNRKLFGFGQRGKYFCRWYLDHYQQGDAKSRFEVYTNGLNNGVYSVNEVRRKEGLNPIKEGDQHLQPLNMVALGTKPKDEPQPGADKPGMGNDGTKANSDESSTGGASRQVVSKAQARLFAEAAERTVKRTAKAITDIKATDRKAFEIALDKTLAEHCVRLQAATHAPAQATAEVAGLPVDNALTDSIKGWAIQHVVQVRRSMLSAFDKHEVANALEQWAIHAPAEAAKQLPELILSRELETASCAS